MEQSRLNQYSSADGFGTIKPDDEHENVLVFGADVIAKVSLVRNKRLEYEVVVGPKGPEATDVHEPPLGSLP